MNYWLCLLLAVVGVSAGIYGLAEGKIAWLVVGAAVAVIALLVPRLRGRGKVPIPGMEKPLEGDFAAIGEPGPQEERVIVVVEPEDPEQPPERPPPQE